tara:strand:- start:585 stop:794 length:210 start_codon:yes stop_codon:yes gene_type:complete
MQKDIEERLFEAIQRIATHEAMCEERSKTIFNRLESIDAQLAKVSNNMFVVSLSLLGGMAGIIVTLILR